MKEHKIYTPWSKGVMTLHISSECLVSMGIPAEQINDGLARIHARISTIDWSQVSDAQARDATDALIYDEAAYIKQMLGGYKAPELRIAPMRTDSKRIGGDELHRPPAAAEYIVYLLLSKAKRAAVLGDLNEEYGEVREKFGKNAAALWYWRHAIHSCGPLGVQWILRLLRVYELLNHWTAK